ncbi:MAG: OmpA family protein [Prevotellaceae bacterium]|jgi:chemotaxis protein MotB|nr:OmpA family protein [Prevotellaceae bacterium]
MKYAKICFILLIPLLGLTSCVSSTQYNSLNTDYRLLLDDRNNINKQMNNLANENEVLKRRLKELEAIAKQFEITEAERVSLQKQLVELQGLMERSRRQSIKETGSMSIEIQRTREELQKREDDLAAKLRELQQMQDEMEQRNKRLMELEAILARKDSMVTALRRKVSDALLGFEGKGLSVHTKNGKVYVSMEDKLLFKSGSYDIEARGAVAINDLAQMLAQNPEINVLIEGHTDDVTYRGKSDLKDNWDLSVKRATSVVRELLRNSQIDARRITAAGRGEFIPLDSAKTTDARQKNRRIEIILTPKLDELFKILE